MMTKIIVYWFALLSVFPLAAQNKLVGFSAYNVPGDPYSGGLLFSVHEDGSDLQILQNFSTPPLGNFSENTAPLNLMLASDGKFYGVAQPWTTGSNAFVFSLNPDGTNFQTVFTLPAVSYVYNQLPTLFEGSDGWLYGGGLFRLRKDGSAYQVLYNIASNSNFLEGPDERIYWLQGFDLMRMEKNGSAKTKVVTLHEKANNEESPSGRLYRLQNGWLFGQFDYVFDNGGSSFSSIHLIFTFDPATGQLHTQQLSEPWLSGMAVGADGYVYRLGLRIDPNDLSVTVLPSTGCTTLSGYITQGLMTTTGLWIGSHVNDNFDAHGLLAWHPTDGTCAPLITGTEPLPYRAIVAFELPATIATHQAGDTDDEVQLYPNPVTELLTVHTALSRPADWRLVDATGRCVLTGHVPSSDSWTIPLAELPKGVYFLKINGLVKKVLKG